MQEIKIFFYDQMMCEGMLSRYKIKCKIMSIEYAFTYGLLRYSNNKYFFYKSKRPKLIFGKLFTLLISDEDLYILKLCYSVYKLNQITCTPLYRVKDLYTCNYQTKKEVQAYVFESCINTFKDNRRADSGNMSKYINLF